MAYIEDIAPMSVKAPERNSTFQFNKQKNDAYKLINYHVIECTNVDRSANIVCYFCHLYKLWCL